MSTEIAIAATVVEEPKATFDSFDEMVSYFRGKVLNIQKSTLQTCWEMGFEANLIKQNGVYGEKTLENFVEKLDIPNISSQTLYRYGQFAAEYTKEQLEAVSQKEHVGWGAVNKLLSIKNVADREKFEDKLDKGEIKPSELENAISLYMSQQGASEGTQEGEVETAEPASATTSGRRSYIKHCKKGSVLCETLTNTIPLAIKDMQDLDQIADDDDKYDKALEYVFAVREAAEALKPLLEELITEAAKRA